MNNIKAVFFMMAMSIKILTLAQVNKCVLIGNISDSLNNHIQNGSIVIYATKDSSKKYTSVLTNTGKFRFDNLDYGDYVINISSIGYSHYQANILINKSFIDAGNIILSYSARNLDEVIVTGRKKIMETLPGKTVYNVSADPMAIGKSVTEIAANIPGIAINGEGGLMVDGESRVIILVNGRKSNANPIDLLNQLPPSNIEKLELISGADPRFASMDGVAVLNIVLKKNKQSGISGNSSIQASTLWGYNFSFNISKYTGKFNLYSYISSDDRFMVMPRSSKRKNINTNEVLLDNKGENNVNHSLRSIILGADIYMDSLNSLTIENKFSHHQDDFIGITNSLINNSGSFIKSTINLNSSPRDIENTLSLNYMRKFKNPKKYWETEVSGTLFNLENNSTYIPSGVSEQLNLKNLAVQARSEFNTPFKRKGEWNFGFDISYANTKNLNTQVSLNPFPLSQNTFNYQKNKIALYTSYIFKIKQWSLRPGLRTERIYTNLNQSQSTPITFDLIGLFPTLNLLWSGKNNKQVIFDFIRKVQYPELFNFFTQPNQSDTFDINAGNPLLTPAIRNELAIQYKFNIRYVSFHFKAFSRLTTNALYDASVILPGNKIVTSEMNIGDIFTYGGSANINVKGSSKWNIKMNANASFSNVVFKKELFSSFSNFYSFGGSIVNQYAFSGNFDAECTWRVMHVYRDINEISIKPMYNLSFQVNRKIVNGKWVISLFASDILNTMRRNYMVIPAPDIEQFSQFRLPMRFIQATVRYRFGGSAKQREKKIELEKEIFNNG
jgi:hypothetical protein